MTDPPGVQPTLGVESVEWFPSGGQRLIVRVTGRWLRRPPPARGQPTLVVAADDRRHRFTAVPEPPTLRGAPPGVWQRSFSVPAWLAPHLSRRLSLQIGGVTIPLPGAVAVTALTESETEQPEVEGGPEPEDGSEAGAGTPDAEPSDAEPPDAPPEEPARRRAADVQAAASQLAARIASLEGELREARREPAPSADEAKLAMAELASAEARLRELEEQTAALRRPTGEGAQMARVAGPLREEIDVARGASVTPANQPAFEATEPRGLRRELEMLAGRARQPPALAGTGGEPGASPEEAERQTRLLEEALAGVRLELDARIESEARLKETITALRRELQARTAAEAKVRALLATAQGSLDARISSQALLERTLDDLRSELSDLQLAGEREETARSEAESRAATLGARVAELESQLAPLEAARDAAGAEARELRSEVERLRADLADAREISSQEAAALSGAETLLAQAHQLAADAQERLADTRMRQKEAVAAREQVEREFADYRARSIRVHDAIEDLRRQLAAVRSSHGGGGEADEAQAAAEPEPAPDAEPAARPEAQAEPERTEAEVAPERLTEALSRLREAVPDETAPAPAPAPTAQPGAPQTANPWLGRVLKALAAEDPIAAGRLVVELLPAQSLADPRAVSYELVLHDNEYVLVRATETTQVQRGAAPRPSDKVDFRVTGDLASLGRLIVASRSRRRFGRRVARVDGDRGAFGALRSLGRARIPLDRLHAAGVRLDAPLMLKVVSLMVAPAWTRGERFTVAFESSVASDRAIYLQVSDGAPLSLNEEAPLGPVAITIVSPAESLLPLFAGRRPVDVVVRGDERPLALLQQWVQRAQSG